MEENIKDFIITLKEWQKEATTLRDKTSDKDSENYLKGKIVAYNEAFTFLEYLVKTNSQN